MFVTLASQAVGRVHLPFRTSKEMVLSYLQENNCIIDSHLLMTQLHFTHAQARQSLSRMARHGIIERVSYGKYRRRGSLVTLERNRSYDRRSHHRCIVGRLLSDHDRGWLEALIDGEGTLGLHSWGKEEGYWVPVLRVSNTNQGLLERMVEIVGPLSIRAHQPKGPNCKVVYDVACYSSYLRWLLPQLRLVAKEEHRVLLIEAVTILGRRRGSLRKGNDGLRRLSEIHARIAELNRKGPH